MVTKKASTINYLGGLRPTDVTQNQYNFDECRN